MASDVARCEPPEERRGERWHWLKQANEEPTPWEWVKRVRVWNDGGGGILLPEELARRGFRYIAPALPPEPKGETDGR